MIDALTGLGLASIAFTAVFTATVARSEGGSGQTRRSSLIEAWANIGIGFGINYVINMLVFPLVGASLTLGQNFWVGCIFTGVSVLRSYAIRRYFNHLIHTTAVRLAGERQP